MLEYFILNGRHLNGQNRVNEKEKNNNIRSDKQIYVILNS